MLRYLFLIVFVLYGISMNFIIKKKRNNLTYSAACVNRQYKISPCG